MECDAVPNTDGGKYQFRCTRVQLAAPPMVNMQPDNTLENLAQLTNMSLKAVAACVPCCCVT